MLDDLLVESAGCLGQGLSARWFILGAGLSAAVVGFFMPTWTMAAWVWLCAAGLIFLGLVVAKHLDHD